MQHRHRRQPPHHCRPTHVHSHYYMVTRITMNKSEIEKFYVVNVINRPTGVATPKYCTIM